MEEKIGSNRQHKLILQNRGKGNITGICDVVSFDENAVVLDTDMGLLTIKGKELHVSRLTLEKGEVDTSPSIPCFQVPAYASHIKVPEKSIESVIIAIHFFTVILYFPFSI